MILVCVDPIQIGDPTTPTGLSESAWMGRDSTDLSPCPDHMTRWTWGFQTKTADRSRRRRNSNTREDRVKSRQMSPLPDRRPPPTDVAQLSHCERARSIGLQRHALVINRRRAGRNGVCPPG